MYLTTLRLERFTAFGEIEIKFSPGVNVFIGANGTGKTHILKVAYAACDVSKTKLNFAEKLVRVFLPSNRNLGRLVKRHRTSSRCMIEVNVSGDRLDQSRKLTASFSNHSEESSRAKIAGAKRWSDWPIESAFIPVKEMLAHTPGFLSLYEQREIHFEETYRDILVRANLPALRGPIDRNRKKLMDILQDAIEGKVTSKNEEFFLRNKQGNLEFSLLAEGMRKLGLLWLLIQNGTLTQGATLFWDEPETNLNPKLYGILIDILLELQRMGVQVFLATHDYVILKELDLRKTSQDRIDYHSLYRDQATGELKVQTENDYLRIHPNVIDEAFTGLYDREIERSLGGKGV
jgi:predicted ATPase